MLLRTVPPTYNTKVPRKTEELFSFNQFNSSYILFSKTQI